MGRWRPTITCSKREPIRPAACYTEGEVIRVAVEKIIWCQFVWNHPVVHLPAQIHSLLIKPEPGSPHGNKGAVMRQAWLRWRAVSPGIVFVDGDVGIDPWDMRAMNQAVRSDPTVVWTGMAWLWPSNPVQEAPKLSHRTWHQGEAQWGMTGRDGRIDYWSFNTTYVPNRLFARVEQERKWSLLVFPWADTRLSEIAQESPRIPAYIVPECRPKHLNWG